MTNSPPAERWLRCQVDRGMFSDEMAVTYPTHGTAITSVFVPSSDVLGMPGGLGKVRVLVRKSGNILVAILPTEYRDAVPVAEVDLSETP